MKSKFSGVRVSAVLILVGALISAFGALRSLPAATVLGASLGAFCAWWTAVEQANSEKDATAKSDEITNLSKQIVAKSDKIAELTNELSANVTGGDSFCVFSLISDKQATGESDTMRLSVSVHGKYPLYDVRITVVDVTKQKIQMESMVHPVENLIEKMFANQRVFSFATLYPNEMMVIEQVGLSDLGTQEYSLQTVARNGRFRQNVFLRRFRSDSPYYKSDNPCYIWWGQSYQVVKEPANEVLTEWTDIHPIEDNDQQAEAMTALTAS